MGSGPRGARRTGADHEPRAGIVDIGGGTGGFAVPLAELGHHVRVIDPSPDALAALDRRARESGVADRVTGQQGDLGDLAGLVDAGSVDLVLCHGVLEVVDDPAAALAAIAGVLRPGGHLSLLVAQRHAAVVARAMAGHFQAARDLLDAGTPSGHPGRGGHRFTRDELEPLLADAGLATVTVHAVRVFADLVPGSLLDLEPGPRRRWWPSSRRWRPVPSTSPSPPSCTSSPAPDPRRSRARPRAVAMTALPVEDGHRDPSWRAPLLHVDMDAFYASVATRDRPDLADVPVIVGGGSRGVVLSANYLARQYGVRSALPMTRARRMCPHAVVIAPDFETFGAVSSSVMENFRRVTPLLEVVSLDEAFLDVRGSTRRLGSPRDIATLLRATIHDEQGITCSVGVAASVSVAKLASRRAKPDGVVVVPPERVTSFLHPLDVGELWGVGDKTREMLHRLGLVTVGDVAHIPLRTLQRAVGVHLGSQLHDLAWGTDRRTLTPRSGRSSRTARWAPTRPSPATPTTGR